MAIYAVYDNKYSKLISTHRTAKEAEATTTSREFVKRYDHITAKQLPKLSYTEAAFFELVMTQHDGEDNE